jgi:tetratricopeptide (TPR) repeat protein
MPFSRFLNVLRVLFLGVCIVAVGARVAWTYHPEKVDELDQWIIKKSQQAVRSQLELAKESLAAGDTDAATAHLEKVAEGTADTKRGDRLEEVRTDALTALRDVSYREGNVEEALEWANQLHMLDERILPNELARAKLFGALGMLEESKSVFELLDDVTQGNGVYQLAYFDQLIQASQGKEALELLFRMSSGNGLARPLSDWKMLYRSANAPWSKAKFFDLAGDVSVSGAIELDAPVDSLLGVRLDPPANTTFVVEDPKLVFLLEDGTDFTLELSDVGRARHMEKMPTGWRGTAKAAPNYVINKPQVPGESQIVGIRFAAEVQPALSEAVKEFLESDLGARAMEEMAADHQAGGGTDQTRAQLLALREVLRG